MKKINKNLEFILSMCLFALLFCGNLEVVQAQSNVPVVLETFDGLDLSTWEQVSEPGFGNDDNVSVVAMAEYDGHLYAVTRNEITGAELWRTAAEGWELVVFPGGHTSGAWGNKRLNNLWSDMRVFQNRLYVGFSGGLKGEGLKSTGCEIWRFDGSVWEPVISNRADTEESGLVTAVSDCSAADTATTAVFTDSNKFWTPDQWQGGVLQILDANGLWRPFHIVSNTVDSLTVQQNEIEGNAQGVEYTICADQPMTVGFPPYNYELGAVGVGSTYEIGTGSDESGFGDPWNKTITDMEEFNGQLYVATGLNSEYGAQVWRTSDGDIWEVVAPARSLGLFHSNADYLNGQQPVCSSITSLCESRVSGKAVLYAGAIGTFGDQGNSSRMARLTENGWELIVDKDVDTNDTGTNESGFGDGSSFNASYLAKLTGNFMPWSLAAFDGKLMAGVMSLGGTRVLYSNDGSPDDGSWHYAVGGDSSIPVGFDGLLHPEPTLTSWGVYENIAAVLYPFGQELYLGMLTLYEPGFEAHEQYMTGAEMWKTSDGVSWTQVTGDGFGDTQTVAFEGFTTFNNRLYVSGSKGCTDVDCGMAAAKIYRMAAPCATTVPDQAIADKFERYTVAGITEDVPGPDPNPAGFLGASFLRVDDLDGDGQKEIVVTSVSGESGKFMVQDGAVAVFTRTSEDLSTWTQSVIRADFAWANDTLLRDVDGDGEVDIMVFDNFLAGAFTNQPAGIYLLKNLGGDVTDPANWEKITLYAKDPAEAGIDVYERAKRRASYHQAYFVDLDGDGREDFVTTRISMEIWQARATSPLLYEQQYMWTEWFKAETDLVAYPAGFSGPYDVGDGIGFLMDMYDVDDDGLLDVIGPQFFITEPGSLIVKGSPDGSDPYGDSLVWFKNPGQAVLSADPDYAWERYTIDNWYTSSNPVGKGFMMAPADITNDGNDELIVTSHNHQDSVDGNRVWPSGIYYLDIPDDPYDSANWAPVAIDTGDAYSVDRPGGPYSQGSPGFAAVGDITGNGLNDIVVAGDGRGSTYYYEAQQADAGCSLKFKRAALYDDPASMPAEIKLYDIDGDGALEILGTVYDTSLAKDSSSGSVFIWKLIPEAECTEDNDCEAGYECVGGSCVLIDDPPAITGGPFLAAGTWPVLPTDSAGPVYLEQNEAVLWTFSDDYAAGCEDCTHVAEYQAVGAAGWTSLAVTSDKAQGYAHVQLPITSLINATTYAFRFSVTDCATPGQSAQSQTYYFRVATEDAPPTIESGPFLATGWWPVLSKTASQAFVISQDEDVLWSFDDDYATCSDMTWHRARYHRIVEDGTWVWEWLEVNTDSTEKEFAYVRIPASSMEAGTYRFVAEIIDCAGQLTRSTTYFFKVE